MTDDLIHGCFLYRELYTKANPYVCTWRSSCVLLKKINIFDRFYVIFTHIFYNPIYVYTYIEMLYILFFLTKIYCNWILTLSFFDFYWNCLHFQFSHVDIIYLKVNSVIPSLENEIYIFIGWLRSCQKYARTHKQSVVKRTGMHISQYILEYIRVHTPETLHWNNFRVNLDIWMQGP